MVGIQAEGFVFILYMKNCGLSVHDLLTVSSGKSARVVRKGRSNDSPFTTLTATTQPRLETETEIGDA